MILVPVGCLQHGHKFLVQQRKPEALRGGLWEMPGGKREPGETMALTLQREWLEEVGIEIAVHELLAECALSFPDAPDVLLPLFRVTVSSHTLPAAQEGQKLAWMTLEELEPLAMVPSMYKYWTALEKLSADESDSAVLWTTAPEVQSTL